MLVPCHAARDRDYILNDERRMTNDETNPNDEIQNRSWPITGFLPFGFCHSFVIRHSCFVILLSHPLGYFDPEQIQPALQNPRGKIAQRQTRAARRFF